MHHSLSTSDVSKTLLRKFKKKKHDILRFETAHVHVRPLKPHVHITHEPRTYYVHSTDNHLQNWNVREACVFWRAPSVIHASGVHRMFVEYCTVFARMRRRARYVSDSSVIVSDTCAVHTWFVSDFYPPTPWEIGQFLGAQTQSARDLWVIRAWSAVWLAV
jgi:hypothetical protein